MPSDEISRKTAAERAFAITLRCFAPIMIVVGVLHLVLGLGAESLLGAAVPPAAMVEPSLDSQNRFYGVAFSLNGFLLVLCAGDIPRYAPVIRCLLWVFFAAGLSRFVSIAVHGLPALPFLLLMGAEVAAPPLLLLWLARLRGVVAR